MGLDYCETAEMIDLVLNLEMETAAKHLASRLADIERTMPEFYDGVIEHGPGMDYTSDQWLDFHLKVPHWRLRDCKALMDKLSPKQREILELASSSSLDRHKQS